MTVGDTRSLLVLPQSTFMARSYIDDMLRAIVRTTVSICQVLFISETTFNHTYFMTLLTMSSRIWCTPKDFPNTRVLVNRTCLGRGWKVIAAVTKYH
ncbi:hypothetical protein NPIL_21571 [Nephila pilipes]|uniref:Uncharacterized protein n=1 Tax=Nephila pilipes TaxID=299642 RepID=A0A8X6Q6E8_NEPPI|nr:hypothetical protein NPIL_21571 [Nephila pilipes]